MIHSLLYYSSYRYIQSNELSGFRILNWADYSRRLRSTTGLQLHHLDYIDDDIGEFRGQIEPYEA